ncbi:alpha/beta hydrolase [Listeria sp. FSL L7-1485]|uniref:Alpha/beta hydrolase n=1 Tax=Listeria immobilis TaxID=2713502 RepID=A0A7X1C9U0_9LIST|nr:alpha/beta hydrolase [Listeria immobilis]MBC1489661.1 alpha/beta hydrolase [Listeria immobilis]MBC1515537.1 alpha/beta hydrolase [Listeria immobilis]MBC1536636.1 alpha/beta hydrolase [Listeria immobilis]
MPFFKHEGIDFNYEIQGEGIPLLFLHGLGDNLEFAFETFNKDEKIQLISMDQRGHGKSGHDSKKLSYDRLASDALALMDYLGIQHFYVGGLSMGAGVALNLAVHETNRVTGLILLRSSATDEPMKKEVIEWFRTVSNYLPKKNGQQLFEQDPIFQSIKDTYPKAIDTFERYFEDEASVHYYKKFIDIPKDSPIKNKSELTNLTIPVLILSNKHDVIHPIEYSLFYERYIENSSYFELTPKTVDAEKHKLEIDTYIKTFIIGIQKTVYKS